MNRSNIPSLSHPVVGAMGWGVVGLLIRLWNLGGKPPSSIEISSIGFGLGQGFADLPLDRLISPFDLLMPLQVSPTLGIADVIARLSEQSNHPPLFFALMHVWLKGVTPAGTVVDLSLARLLSVLIGALTIPLGFWIAYRLGRSLISPDHSSELSPRARHRQRLWFAHGVAALFAVSPYGSAIAQEARHYTLAVLWALVTWTATLIAAQRLKRGRSPGLGLGIIWILGNHLALATHYLSLLGIVAQGLAIAAFAIVEGRAKGWRSLTRPAWRFMGLIALVQGLTLALWLPAITGLSSNELTTWIQDDLRWDELLLVPLRLLLWIVTMGFLVPLEGQPIAVIIPSAVVLILLLGITVQNLAPIWFRGLRYRSGEWALWGPLAIGAIAPPLMMIVLAQTGRGDLSLAPRYQFVHFVPVVLTLGLLLGRLGGQGIPAAIARWKVSGRRLVVLLLLASALGSFWVVSGAGFQKSRQLDRLWDGIDIASASRPILVVTEIETYSEIRGTVAIAYEWQRRLVDRRANPFAQPIQPPQFLMLQKASNRDGGEPPLAQAMAHFPKSDDPSPDVFPLDLWAIDFSPELNLEKRGCAKQDVPRRLRRTTGYRLRHYRCSNSPASVLP